MAESRLRELGFGYRAKFLVQTIAKLKEKGSEGYLDKLKGRTHWSSDKKCERLENLFLGVGRKVSQCVCLMSLKGYDCVPVDTHIHSIYLEHYAKKPPQQTKKKHSIKKPTLTKQTHKSIQHFFGSKFGALAGWTQSFLFTTRLT